MRIEPRALIRIALAAVLLAVVSHTRADADLWGHVLFGRDIVAERQIPRADPYSFTTDKPWINHEWLSETAMYLAYAAAGGPGLAALKILLVLAMLAVIWLASARQGIDTGPRDILLALSIVGTFPQANHMRPQVFSLLAFAAMLALLLRADPTTSRRLFAIPAIFAFWVNFHGGWIVGGGALAVWTAVSCLGPAPPAYKLRLLLAGVLSLLATLVNPYGWNMWLFLQSTVGFGRAEITDWQPAYRLGAAYVAIWLLVALAAVAGAARALRSGDWKPERLAIVAMLGAASLQVNRLLAFFAIATVLCLGRELAAVIARRRSLASPPRVRRVGVAGTIAVLIAVALATVGAVATSRNVSCVRIEDSSPEPEVVGLMRAKGLQGRLAVWFDWGQYAIWHLAPALSVSIDGRRETIYTDEVTQKHLAFYYTPASRERFLAETRPDHVWLPPDFPVVPTLQADGWTTRYSGPRSVWLSRTGEALDAGVEPGTARSMQANAGRRCFPGP